MPKLIEERKNTTTTAPWTDAGMHLDMASKVPLYAKGAKVECATGIYNEGVGATVATVGGRYALVQHEEVLLAALNALEEMGIEPTAVQSIQSDTRGTLVIMLSQQRDVGRYGWNDRMQSISPKADDGLGDVVHFGLRFINTFDGTSPVKGGVFAKRLACMNGMVSPMKTITTISKKHTESAIADLVEDVRLFVRDAVAEIATWTDELTKAAQVVITADEAERLVDATFNKRLADKVKAKVADYAEELGPSRWAVYNAATHVLTHDMDPSQPTLERYHAAANRLLTAEVPAEVVAE